MLLNSTIPLTSKMSAQRLEFEVLRTEREPLVSVIMPARNEEEYIAAAIDSILQQSYKRFQLIVIDDRSSDRTFEIASQFRDPRMRVYMKGVDETPGAPASRNIGAQRASGELIAYQDADDVSHPLRIERQVKEFLGGEKPRIVGTWIEYRLGAEKRVPELPIAHNEIVAGLNRLYNRVTFVSGTMLLPRSLAIEVPGRSRFRYFEDLDQLCRLAELGWVEFCNIPEPLYTYNIRPKGSKGQIDWAFYNVFERACRSRRQSGREEWKTKEEFEEYLNRSPLDLVRWRSFQFILHLKVQFELRRIRSCNRRTDACSRTWG